MHRPWLALIDDDRQARIERERGIPGCTRGVVALQTRTA